MARRVAPSPSLRVLHSFGGAHDIGEPDAEFLVDHHHFAACNAHAVHQYVERLARKAVKLDHRAGRQLQKVAHRHPRASDFERQRDRDIENQIQIHFLAAGAGGVGRQIAELRARDGGCFGIGRAHVWAPEIILTALCPCEMPNLPRCTGTSPANSVTCCGASMGMMSPGDKLTKSRRLICACARIARVSICASCSAAVSAGAQACCLRTGAAAPLPARDSRMGASNESGKSQSIRPLRAANSTVNLATTTDSSWPPNCSSRGLVSCFTSSSSSGAAGSQAAAKSAAKLRTISVRNRCAAGATAAKVSALARPDPPKKPSSSVNNSAGSTLTYALPVKGLRRTTARLAGAGNDACRSALFTDSRESNCMLASRPSNPHKEGPARSAKFLLMSSSRGNCVRLMRCNEKS